MTDDGGYGQAQATQNKYTYIFTKNINEKPLCVGALLNFIAEPNSFGTLASYITYNKI